MQIGQIGMRIRATLLSRPFPHFMRLRWTGLPNGPDVLTNVLT